MSLSTLKRKYEEDIAIPAFNINWEEDFLFSNQGTAKPVCLICGFCVAVPKKFNLKWHFKQRHSDFNSKYPAGSTLRTDFIKKKKKKSLTGQQLLFQKRSEEVTSVVKASYEISLLLARKKKSYSDGEEIVKSSLQIFAKHAEDPKIMKLVNELALSRNTMMRRIDDMATDINSQIMSSVHSCTYFSLAIDESCDVSDTAQLSVFVRSINDNFDLIEELLDLRQLVITKGEDVFNELKNVIEHNKLEWGKLDSICTDGAPAMIGKKGCIALLEEFLERKIFKYHCILHQEALCAKDLKLSSVLDPVVRCINKIRAHALNRREFHSLFEEEMEEMGELLLHCNVRWLSKGKALERFWSLRQCVLKYLEENGELPSECSLLKDEDWLWDLAFLTDIMEHLNILNLHLQGKDCLFPTLVSYVSSFMMKLLMFSNDFSQNNLSQFTRMKEQAQVSENAPNYERYKSFISVLQDSFAARFCDFQKDKTNIELFTNPFSIDIGDLNHYPPDMRIEIIDLQNNIALKSKYNETVSISATPNYIEFWKFLPVPDFPTLHELALRYCCRFGSTYVCEQAFSVMNTIKTRYHSKLTDAHLNNVILLACSKVNPNIEELVRNKQIQKPH